MSSDEKEITVNEVPPFLRETTPEEQKEKVEHSTTILKRMESKVDKALGNLDVGASMAGTGLFVLGGAKFEAGDYNNGVIYIVVAIIISLVKNRLPEGAIAKFLRKPLNKIVEDVTSTLTHRAKKK